MVVVFIITESNYFAVSLFYNLMQPLSHLCLRFLVLWLRYLPCFRHSDKSG